jgi:hypothetical protein
MSSVFDMHGGRTSALFLVPGMLEGLGVGRALAGLKGKLQGGRVVRERLVPVEHTGIGCGLAAG